MAKWSNPIPAVQPADPPILRRIFTSIEDWSSTVGVGPAGPIGPSGPTGPMGGTYNVDGGDPSSIYGGILPLDAGGI